MICRRKYLLVPKCFRAFIEIHATFVYMQMVEDSWYKFC